MNDTKISVLIPAYNAEETIRRCIDSVLNQRFTDYEVIIVNDGSVDNTAETVANICKRDNRVKLVDQANKGVSAARNTALSLAKGKYVMFIDGDDYVGPQYLKAYYEMAEEHLADVVVGGCTVKNLDNGTMSERNLPIAGDITKLIWHELSKNTSLFGLVCCKLIKRSLIENYSLSFDEQMYSQEDLRFNLNVYSYAEKIIGFDNIEYTYEYKTSKRDPDIISYIKNQLLFGEICKDKGVLDSQILASIQDRLKDYCFVYLMYSKKRSDALSELQKIPRLIAYLRGLKIKSEKDYVCKLVADSHGKLVLFHFALRDVAKRILGRGTR